MGSDEARLRSEGDVNLGAERQAWLRHDVDRDTAQLLAEDERYFLRQSLSTPCLDALVASDGIYLIDAQGRRIMDFHGNSVHQVGYGNPRVIEAVKTQLERLPFCPRRFTNRAAIDLARRLVELSPEGLDKVLFAPGGTAAMGIALKLVRAASGRHNIVSMWDAFHGASLDAISVGGDALFRNGMGPLLTGVEHVPPPTRGRCRFNCDDSAHSGCVDYVDYVMEKQGEVAALVAEPMRWTTVEPPPPDYWPRIREVCDRHGALLVFDEIPGALGRTGSMFICEQIGAVPDILVLGKGLGGAVMPMAAVIARADLDVAAQRALGHYTHEKSSVGCAAALATLEAIVEDDLLSAARDLGAYALARLQEMATRHELVHEVRGMGLHLGVDLRRDGVPAVEAAEKVLYHSLRNGLSYKIGGGCVLTLSPPLTIGREDLDRALDIVERGIDSVG